MPRTHKLERAFPLRRDVGAWIANGDAIDRPDRPEGRDRYFVEALGRGLAILDCLATGAPVQTLAELADHSGLSKPTAFRLLRTLENFGYVRQDAQTRHYQLSLKVFDLQDSSIGALEYPRIARPFMEKLHEELDEAVNMAVLEGTRIRYVARVHARRIMTVSLNVGSTLPAHATSMGKILLAQLPAESVQGLYANEGLRRFTARTITTIDALLAELAVARKRGYALCDGELELGLRSVAAPVRGLRGNFVASLNVSTASARTTRERMQRTFVPSLLRTAEALSRRLGSA